MARPMPDAPPVTTATRLIVPPRSLAASMARRPMVCKADSRKTRMPLPLAGPFGSASGRGGRADRSDDRPRAGPVPRQGRPTRRGRRSGRARRLHLDLGAADPRRLRRDDRRHADGRTRPTRIELGTAVVPIQTRHPIAMAQQALSNQAVCEGRFTLGLGPSHHWIVTDMLGLPYEKPARLVRNYLEVLERRVRRPGSGRRRERRVPRTQPARRHRHPDAGVARGAGAGDVAHRGRARRRARSSGWPTNGPSAATWCRASLPRPTAGRPAPRIVAGVPVALCENDEVDDARGLGQPGARARRVLTELPAAARARRRDRRRRPPRRGRRAGGGDAPGELPRRRVTDLAVRVLPLGPDRAARASNPETAPSRVPRVALSRALSRADGAVERSGVVVHDDVRARRERLARQDPAVLEVFVRQGVVGAHRARCRRRGGPCTSRSFLLARERRPQPAAPCGLEHRVTRLVLHGVLAPVEADTSPTR